MSGTKNRPVQSIYDIAHLGIIVAELFIVELIHYAWHAYKRQLLNSLTAEVDALVDFGLFLVGPLAENKINLMAARELVADAEAHTGEIGG